jgi:hypothetical protein
MSKEFDHYCSKGNLKMVAYMIATSKHISDQMILSGFVYACEYNQLRVAKYLHVRFGPMLGAFMTCFYNACINNHLEIASWLFGIFPYQDRILIMVGLFKVVPYDKRCWYWVLHHIPLAYKRIVCGNRPKPNMSSYKDMAKYIELEYMFY